MFTKEKIDFAEKVMWGGLDLTLSTEQSIEMMDSAYPGIKGIDALKYTAMHTKIEAIATTGFDNVKDFIKLLKETEPSPYYEENDEKLYYSYEVVGANLIHLTKHLTSELKKGSISEDDYLGIYQQISEFKIIQDNVANNPMIDARNISNLINNGNFGPAQCLYKELKEKKTQAGASPLNWSFHVFFSEDTVMLKPLLNGKKELHDEMIEAFEACAKEDRYCTKRATQNFWIGFPQVIDYIKKNSQKELWKEGMSMAANNFGLKRLLPLSSSISDGSAFKAIEGQALMFAEAKRSGYKISTNEYRSVVDTIERIAKSKGADWADQIPADVSKNMTEAFKGSDKKSIIGRKKTENLVPALHRIMPNSGWTELLTQEKRRNELVHALDI